MSWSGAEISVGMLLFFVGVVFGMGLQTEVAKWEVRRASSLVTSAEQEARRENRRRPLDLGFSRKIRQLRGGTS